MGQPEPSEEINWEQTKKRRWITVYRDTEKAVEVVRVLQELWIGDNGERDWRDVEEET